MAIIGTFTIANYRSFGEDETLKSAISDIQTLVRSAQTNASTGLKCENLTAKRWRSDFYRQGSIYKIRLSCFNDDINPPTPRAIKYLILPANIKMEDMTIDGSTNTLPNSFTEPWGGSYASLIFETPSATLSFRCVINWLPDSVDWCSGGTPDGKLIVRLKNTQTNTIKSLTIDKGGRVYEQ